MGRFVPGERSSGSNTGPTPTLLPGQLAPFGQGRYRLFFGNGSFQPTGEAVAHRIRVLGGGAYGLTPGGASSFATLISATGGLCGSGVEGGLGGVGVGGDFQASGGPGGTGGNIGGEIAGGGGGGAGSPLGDGGAGGSAWAAETGSRRAGGGGAVGGQQPLPASATRAGQGASAISRTGINVLGNLTVEPVAGIMRFIFDGFRGAAGDVQMVVEPGSGGAVAVTTPGGSGAGGHGAFTSGLTISPSIGGAGGGGGGGWGTIATSPSRSGARSLLGGGAGGFTSPSYSEPSGGGGGGGYAHGVFDLIASETYAVTVAGGSGTPGIVIVEW